MVLGLALVAGSAQSRADVTASIVPASGTLCAGTTAAVSWVPTVGKWDVSITVPSDCANSNLAVNIRGATTDRIRNIAINVQAPQVVEVSVRGPSGGQTITSVDVINSTGSVSTSTVLIKELRTSGDVERIIVNGMYGVDIGGTITDYIDLIPGPPGGLSQLGETLPVVIAGPLLKPITVQQGFIDQLTVTNGIGTVGSPVNIRAKDGIRRMSAAYAHVNLDAAWNGGSGDLTRLVATTGDITGSVRANNIKSPSNSGIRCALNTPGDLDANVTVLDSIQGFGDASKHVVNVGGEFAAGRTFSVGGTVLAGTNSSLGGMAFGASGLKGQVLINANPSLSGQWLAPIDVGSTTLSPTPGYDELPASLGGGAVGVVPFQLHDEGSLPQNPAPTVEPIAIILDSIINGDQPGDPSDIRNVRVEFYGPIEAESTTAPFTIVFDEGGDMETSAATGWFTWAIDGRELQLARNPANRLPFGVYTLRPDRTGSDRLLCDVAGIAATPVADFTYRFKIDRDCNGNGEFDPIDVSTGYSDDENENNYPDECESGECPECAADFDQNGGVDGGDLAAFFADYEMGLDCADVDGNGGVDGGDLAFFFDVYEAGGCD